MSKDRWLFIVNPVAGRGRAAHELPRIEHLLRSYKLPAKILLTRNSGHATAIAGERMLQGFEKICVVGGDGTLHEVVNGVMDSGRARRARLAILPLGGGNDFARGLGIPRDWPQALNLILQGDVRTVDVGRIEDTWFINALGIGLDARVAWHAQRIARLNGLPRYLAAALKALAERPRFAFDVKLDDQLFRGRFLLATVGMSRYCGGGFQLTPDARPDDGLFDLCFVDAMPLLKTLFLLPLAIRGRHTGRKEVRIMRSARVEVRSRQPLPVYMDGEIPRLRNACHFSIKLYAAQLAFIAPPEAV
ncbi:MAG: diacylglycerol kinase family lipid kinase [Candidatus Cloacimonetes bacterium]|nr:diacylglycerol kinase family lipid kinase [Candidatus Cloacimonadota bacterium]